MQLVFQISQWVRFKLRAIFNFIQGKWYEYLQILDLGIHPTGDLLDQITNTKNSKVPQ